MGFDEALNLALTTAIATGLASVINHFLNRALRKEIAELNAELKLKSNKVDAVQKDDLHRETSRVLEGYKATLQKEIEDHKQFHQEKLETHKQLLLKDIEILRLEGQRSNLMHQDLIPRRFEAAVQMFQSYTKAQGFIARLVGFPENFDVVVMPDSAMEALADLDCVPEAMDDIRTLIGHYESTRSDEDRELLQAKYSQALRASRWSVADVALQEARNISCLNELYFGQETHMAEQALLITLVRMLRIVHPVEPIGELANYSKLRDQSGARLRGLRDRLRADLGIFDSCQEDDVDAE